MSHVLPKVAAMLPPRTVRAIEILESILDSEDVQICSEAGDMIQDALNYLYPAELADSKPAEILPGHAAPGES